MPNFVPYLFLALLSIALLTFTIRNKRQPGLLVLFLCFSGMVFVAEFFVLVIGNAYEYLPDVLSKPYYDNILGSFPSNLFIIPVLALVASVYSLRFPWLVVLSASLMGVEWGFEHLHIYHRFWWRREYTFIVLLFFFGFARLWTGFLHSGHKWTRFISLWMMCWSSTAIVMFIMSVTGFRFYHYGLYTDIYKDDVFIAATVGFVKGFILTAFTIGSRKWGWRLFAPVLLYAGDMVLHGFGVLIIQTSLWLYTLIYLAVASLLLALVVYANNFFAKNQPMFR
ncbi:hypothetical protein [Paenibacillus physcomitrellae]|uniref:Uncharacterized protein n=1 Tax=Paenibacillus physcomitrellae TaxID=1619311 RepID=A0ABQ1FYJ2_9BACL|nr:hypothetical protein [Paenibacillus physcomitrellae]GGA33969.1 hypothetical protein GCM10010917_19000 [Paenibacillus physcomitrellae]